MESNLPSREALHLAIAKELNLMAITLYLLAQSTGEKIIKSEMHTLAERIKEKAVEIEKSYYGV